MYEASDGSGGLSSEQEEFQGHLFEPLAFFLGMGKGWECVCVSVELIHQETSGIQVLIPLFPCLRAGYELLYRNREGDVVKFNVDTDEKTILVHNKKFVSCFFIFSSLLILSQSRD